MIRIVKKHLHPRPIREHFLCQMLPFILTIKTLGLLLSLSPRPTETKRNKTSISPLPLFSDEQLCKGLSGVLWGFTGGWGDGRHGRGCCQLVFKSLLESSKTDLPDHPSSIRAQGQVLQFKGLFCSEGNIRAWKPEFPPWLSGDEPDWYP